MIDWHYRACVGPGLDESLECPHGHFGLHKVKYAPYDGIKNWRCSECFQLHQKLVREKHDLKIRPVSITGNCV